MEREKLNTNNFEGGLIKIFVAIVVPIFIFLILNVINITNRLPNFIFISGPPLMSFIIFYKYSKNFRKSIGIGFLGLIFWIIAFLAFSLWLYPGWH
jgi:hypothetical protein